MILEPAVSPTDYAIAIESAVLAARVMRLPASACRNRFAALFAGISVSAFLGGTVHGFLADEATRLYSFLWTTTLITIGVVGSAAAMAAAASGFSGGIRKATAAIVTGGFAAYCIEVIFFDQSFRWAIIAYAPGTMFLLVSFIAAQFRDSRGKRPLIGAAGVLLTFVAAGVQQTSVRIIGLDHNALYHIVQAFALVMIYFGAVGVVQRLSLQVSRCHEPGRKAHVD